MCNAFGEDNTNRAFPKCNGKVLGSVVSLADRSSTHFEVEGV